MTRLLFLFLFTLPAHALVDAALDRNRIAQGETVTLTLQRDGNSVSQPNLAPLNQDFSIVAKGRSNSLQIIEGRMSAQTQVQLVLSPRHGGRIAIPPLSWDQERSLPLTLEVVGAANAPGPAAGPDTSQFTRIYLSASLGQDRPYEQAAVPLKLRLYTDLPLYQAALSLDANNDVLVQQIGQDSEHSETRDGRNYRVVERDYLLFPQKSGRLRLKGAVLDAQVAAGRGNDPFAQAFSQVFGGMPGGALRPIRVQGEPIVLDVLPRPAGIAAQDWLPAQQLSLEETWSPAPVHAHQAGGRQLRLIARGLTAAQLPDLAARMPLPAGLKAYPDPAQLIDAPQNGGIEGRRVQDIALIAERPGRYEIPELRLDWWDTQSKEARLAVLPARTLEVLPGAAASAAPPPAPAAPVTPHAKTQSAADYWPWLCLAIALLWLATAAYGRYARRRAPAAAAPPGNRGLKSQQTSEKPAVALEPPHTDQAAAMPGGRVRRTQPVAAAGAHGAPYRSGTAKSARKAFRHACRSDAPAAARRHLLAWAAAHWPHDAPLGLNALAQRLDNPEAANRVRELDRACYVEDRWNGAALAEALPELPALRVQGGGDSGPAKLYPKSGG